MKTSLLKHYFDGNFFANTLVCAAFIEREEWEFHLLFTTLVKASMILEPPNESIGLGSHLSGWERMGYVLTERRDGKLYLKPGRHNGTDIRELGALRPEITAAMKEAIPAAEKHHELLAKYAPESASSAQSADASS